MELLCLNRNVYRLIYELLKFVDEKKQPEWIPKIENYEPVLESICKRLLSFDP